MSNYLSKQRQEDERLRAEFFEKGGVVTRYAKGERAMPVTPGVLWLVSRNMRNKMRARHTSINGKVAGKDEE